MVLHLQYYLNKYPTYKLAFFQVGSVTALIKLTRRNTNGGNGDILQKTKVALQRLTRGYKKADIAMNILACEVAKFGG